MPPLIAETAARGRTRFPDLVFTMSDEMRERSSCGASVTSRTRPDAPDGSYTVAPSSSLRARINIPLENNQLAHDSERKSKSEPMISDLGREHSRPGIHGERRGRRPYNGYATYRIPNIAAQLRICHRDPYRLPLQ